MLVHNDDEARFRGRDSVGKIHLGLCTIQTPVSMLEPTYEHLIYDGTFAFWPSKMEFDLSSINAFKSHVGIVVIFKRN